MSWKSLCSGVVLVCLGYPDNSGTGDPIAERYEIYSAAIHRVIPADLQRAQGDPPPTVLINQSTEMSTHFLIERMMRSNEDPWDVAIATLGKLLPEAPKVLLENFRAGNQSSSLLQDRLKLPLGYSLGDFNDQILTYDVRHPGAVGIVSVSNIGFSPAGDWAVVHAGLMKGGRSGYGYMVLLAREKGRWIIKRAVEAWIA